MQRVEALRGTRCRLRVGRASLTAQASGLLAAGSFEEVCAASEIRTRAWQPAGQDSLSGEVWSRVGGSWGHQVAVGAGQVFFLMGAVRRARARLYLVFSTQRLGQVASPFSLALLAARRAAHPFGERRSGFRGRGPVSAARGAGHPSGDRRSGLRGRAPVPAARSAGHPFGDRRGGLRGAGWAAEPWRSPPRKCTRCAT